MSYKFKDLVILIPSFNEEESLKTLTKKLCRNFKNIVVVNDYSTDNSLKILKKYPVKVLNNNKKLGYENSLNKGFNNLKYKYDYLITFDADGQHDINDVKKIYKKIKKTNNYLIIGQRNNKQRLFEHVFAFILKKKFKIEDPLSGLKGINLKKIDKSINEPFNYSGTYILLYCLIEKLKIGTIGVIQKKRIGKSKYGNFLSSNLKILFSIIKFTYILFKNEKL